ncbi:MAG: HAD-IA family hydrolase [Pseudomonadota bacterium]
MIRALLLDVDGVLVRGRPQDGRRWDTSLKADLGLSAKDLATEFFAPYWDAIVVGRKDLRPCLTKALTSIGGHLSADEVVDYWFRHDARLDTALLGDLAALRDGGLPTYLATNQDHLRAGYLMNTLGLKDHVDGIFYSAELGCRKPQSKFFRIVAATLDLDPAELAFIDDQLENVEAARSLGWNGVQWMEGTGLMTALTAAGWSTGPTNPRP